MTKRIVSKQRVSIALAGALAFGFVAPAALLTPAQGAEQVKSDPIKRDKVPPTALQTIDRVVPPGSKEQSYHVQHREGHEVYVVQYTTPTGQKLKLHVNPDGTVFGGQAANPGVDLAALMPAPAPVATPNVAIAPPPAGQQFNVPGPSLPPTATLPQIQQDIGQRQQYIDQLNNRIAQLNQQITTTADPTQRDQLSVEVARLQTEISRQATEVAREDQRIHDIEFQQNPQLAAAYNLPNTNKEDLAETPGGGGQWQINNVPATDVPPAAYATLLRYTKGTHGQIYGKMTHEGQTAYVVHYLDNNNKRYFATVWPDGRVRSEPRISTYQLDANAIQAAGRQQGGAPAQPQAPAVNQGGEKLIDIQPNQVPPAALKELQSFTKGAKNVVYQQELINGQTNYVVHYNNAKDGKRYFATVGPDGKVIKGPTISTYQK